MQINRYRELIQQGRLSELFDLLAVDAESIQSRELRDTLSVLRSRWATHRKNLALGIFSAEEQQKQLDELNRHLLIFLEQIQVQRGSVIPPRKSALPAFVVSIALLIAIMALLLYVPCPSATQYHFFLIALALAAAGFTAMVPGFFQFHQKGVQAGGAVVVFFAVLAFDPANRMAEGKCEADFAQTIYVHGPKGISDRLITGHGAIVMLLPGGEREAAIDQEGKAVFTEIAAKLKNSNIQFYLKNEQPYRLLRPDSLYTLQEGRAIYLEAMLEGVDKLYGNIVDENGAPIAGVKVAIADIFTLTDSAGNFNLIIPPALQKKYQHIICSKAGYLIFEKLQNPMHTLKPFNIVLQRSNE